MSEKIPNFFIVGAPKCGTTALYEYLRTHPNIFMPNQKEPHYFTQDYPKRPFKPSSLDEYLKLFQESSHEHLAIGEASTGYLYSPVAINNIYKFNKDAKIIVMLRNPVEMVYSLHSELLLNLNENEPDFEKAWRLQDSRRKGQNIPKCCYKPSLPLLQYAKVAKYSAQIERLFNIFPREQIKVILFDDFKKSTRSIYEDVLAFLEVPSDGKTEFPIVNPHTTVHFRLLKYIIRRINILFIIKFKKIIGMENDIIVPKILTLLSATNGKMEQRKSLSSSFRSELINEFKDDIEKLSLLLNKDLSHWLKQK